MGTLHEELLTFMIILHWILLRMRNVSDKSYRENQNTQFGFNKFFPKIMLFYEIMWKNMVQPDKLQMTRQYSACSLHAGQLRLQTHSEYITLSAFAQQKLLCERTSKLYLYIHTYIACVVYYNYFKSWYIFLFYFHVANCFNSFIFKINHVRMREHIYPENMLNIKEGFLFLNRKNIPVQNQWIYHTQW